MCTKSIWSTITSADYMAMKDRPHPGLSIKENCFVRLGISVTEAAQVLKVARETL